MNILVSKLFIRNPNTIIRMSTTAAQTDSEHPPKLYVHYDHHDSCRAFRWTAKECYEYMYDRPWEQLHKFYSHLIAQRLALSSLTFRRNAKELSATPSRYKTPDSSHADILFENKAAEVKHGKWERRTFKIHLSYDGSSFDGWQKQPGLNTVQGLVERTLGKFVDEKKAQQVKAKNGLIEAAVAVAGRTDKGVSAFQQVCSFYTWRKDVSVTDVEREINASAPGKFRAVSVSEVSREFHPNFSAKWRRYLYILPLKDGEGDETFRNGRNSLDHSKDFCLADEPDNWRTETEYINTGALNISDDGNIQAFVKPHDFNVDVVNQLLQQLEDKSLSYAVFARDTQASRSRSQATECFMYHARAAMATLPCLEQDNSRERRNVMCVELVANRFLRKMVRVLVSTAVREAAAGAAPDILLKLMEATCRRASAPPAPSAGLCLVDIGYEDMNKEILLIK